MYEGKELEDRRQPRTAAERQEAAVAMFRREGFVFDGKGGPWEKCAFTLYNLLVEAVLDERNEAAAEPADSRAGKGERLAAEPPRRATESGRRFCNACDFSVLEGNWGNHLLGASHQNKERIYRERAAQLPRGSLPDPRPSLGVSEQVRILRSIQEAGGSLTATEPPGTFTWDGHTFQRHEDDEDRCWCNRAAQPPMTAAERNALIEKLAKDG